MDLKEEIKKTTIDKLFLAKTLILLLVFYVALLVINVYYTNQIYVKIIENINKKEVLVIDNNGNQTFQSIGILNIDTTTLFVKQSLKRVFEMSYENRVSLFYAKQYTSKKVYNELNKKYESILTKLKLENGLYINKIKNVNVLSIDERTKTYSFEVDMDLKYYYDGGELIEAKKIFVEIQQQRDLENNYFGLLLTEIKEMTKKEEE